MGMLGRLDHIVSQRLQKEGKLESFMSKISPRSVVGTREFNHPAQINFVEDDNLDFTSCRLNDLAPTFAWGVATAAY
jgi:hypothetical protein